MHCHFLKFLKFLRLFFDMDNIDMYRDGKAAGNCLLIIKRSKFETKYHILQQAKNLKRNMKWHGIDITHDLAKIEYTKEIISQCTLAPMALAVQAVGEILVIWGSPHLILCLPLLEKVRGFALYQICHLFSSFFTTTTTLLQMFQFCRKQIFI